MAFLNFQIDFFVQNSDFPWQSKGCDFMPVLKCLISVPLSIYREQQLRLEIQSTNKPRLGFQHNTELLF